VSFCKVVTGAPPENFKIGFACRDEFMTTFSGLLSSYIKQSGLSVRKAASQSSIPYQTLYNWMKGKQPRWYAALPDDIQRLGVSLRLADTEIKQLIRLSGCDAVRPGLLELEEAPMTHNLRIPKGWTFGGDAPQKYVMGIDPEITYEGRPCITIQSLPNPTDFGALFQTVKAEPYHGKRLRFSAAACSEEVETMAALWMRVGGPEGSLLAFDNMRDRPIVGSTGWTYHAIVLDVAPEAEVISFGLLLAEAGRVWMADVHLDEVGEEVPVTDIISLQNQPANLNFEE
jgi:hypothetical protein